MTYDYTNESPYEVHVFYAGLLDEKVGNRVLCYARWSSPLQRSYSRSFNGNRRHQEDDSYKQDSSDRYNLNINTPQNCWTVIFKPLYKKYQALISKEEVCREHTSLLV